MEEILDRSADAFRRGDAAARRGAAGTGGGSAEGAAAYPSILRMREGKASRRAFVWADLRTDLERTSDHCSNIAGSVIDMSQHNLNIHETLRSGKLNNEEYDRRFREYARKIRRRGVAKAKQALCPDAGPVSFHILKKNAGIMHEMPVCRVAAAGWMAQTHGEPLLKDSCQSVCISGAALDITTPPILNRQY